MYAIVKRVITTPLFKVVFFVILALLFFAPILLQIGIAVTAALFGYKNYQKVRAANQNAPLGGLSPLSAFCAVMFIYALLAILGLGFGFTNAIVLAAFAAGIVWYRLEDIKASATTIEKTAEEAE
jgi:hypothetical protein